MNCDDVRARLGAWLDRELAAQDTAELEAHLEGCAACTDLRERQLALSGVLSRHLTSFEAPAELRHRLEHAARGEKRAVSLPVAGIRGGWWLALAATLAIVAVGSWQLATARANADRLTEEVLGTHIRSLIGEHLTDVASTDQHTVKPWFNGRLDFSPPVYDFAGRGYPLVGGRLEYLGGRQVAALVYERRKHVINVFLWPADGGPAGGRAALTRHGYHLLHWTRPDYAYWVASDLAPAELEEFAALLRQSDSAATLPSR
jgi:anti-sigma factor (TIGR02949 family)